MLTGRKLALTLAFTGLLLLAFGAGCKGFFVQPTLSSITVAPSSQTIETGTSDNTQQFTATGVYNDGSTGNPAVSWTSSEPGFATISASGLATSVSLGQTTITATATQNGTISGTASLTVTVGCIESIALDPTSLSLSASGENNSQQIAANATTCNGPFPITDTATWTSSNTAVATVDAGLVTAVASGTTNITASSGNIVSPAAVVNVSP
jgi:trimeric autotransporter adhesin